MAMECALGAEPGPALLKPKIYIAVYISFYCIRV